MLPADLVLANRLGSDRHCRGDEEVDCLEGVGEPCPDHLLPPACGSYLLVGDQLSVVEAFCAGVAVTARVYPTRDDAVGVAVSATTGATVSVEAHEMRAAF